MTLQPSDQAFVTRLLEQLDPAKVRAWLTDRQANCYRHASTRHGQDREGWLEDAAYFAAAVGMIDWQQLELADQANQERIPCYEPSRL